MFLLGMVARRLIVLAIALAVPVIAAEFLARKLIGDAVRSAVKARIGVSADVSFGASPVVLALIHGRIDTVTIKARRARIGGLPPLTLSATLHDVHLKNLTSLQGAIGSLTLDVRVTAGQVLELLATPGCVSSLPAPVRGALGGSPRVLLFPGRIDLLPARGRAGEVRLAPLVASRDTVAFHVTGLELGGAPASPATLAAARAQVRCSRTLPGLPFGVALNSATVGRGALSLHLSGSGATFSALG